MGGSQSSDEKSGATLCRGTVTEQLTTEKVRVLLVEDSPADVYLIREALQSENLDFELQLIQDGESAARLLMALEKSSEPWPDVVLLDLNMPRCEGREVLQKIKQTPGGTSIPVIVITSSNSPADREDVFKLGASSYFRKPSDLNEFMKIGAVVRQTLSGRSARVKAPD